MSKNTKRIIGIIASLALLAVAIVLIWVYMPAIRGDNDTERYYTPEEVQQICDDYEDELDKMKTQLTTVTNNLNQALAQHEIDQETIAGYLEDIADLNADITELNNQLIIYQELLEAYENSDKFEVIFYLVENGEATPYDAQVIEPNGYLENVDAPAGWFEGWSLTNGGEIIEDLTTIQVTEDMSIYGNYKDFSGQYAVGLKMLNEPYYNNNYDTVLFNVENNNGVYSISPDIQIWHEDSWTEFDNREANIVEFEGNIFDNFSLNITIQGSQQVINSIFEFEFNEETHEFERTNFSSDNMAPTPVSTVVRDCTFVPSEDRSGTYSLNYSFTYEDEVYSDNYKFNANLSNRVVDNDKDSIVYDFEFVSSDYFNQGGMYYNGVFTRYGVSGTLGNLYIFLIFDYNSESDSWELNSNMTQILDITTETELEIEFTTLSLTKIF